MTELWDIPEEGMMSDSNAVHNAEATRLVLLAALDEALDLATTGWQDAPKFNPEVEDDLAQLREVLTTFDDR